MSQKKPVRYLRYTLIFIGLNFALSAVNYIAATFAGLELPTGFASVLTPMFAAMDSGMRYVRVCGQRPSNGYAWITATYMSLIFVAIIIPLAALVFWAMRFGEEEMAPAAFAAAMLLATLVFGVIALISNRIGFGLGAKIQAKSLVDDVSRTFD
ncbi:ABZJ_00895 family protein [Parasulfitobacter algicola]|uniref:Uncharacterized protein n=1 Tax=Parasulfitobacter algicola TaxID=2614809 RepID=A0ABX2IS73_9RHOB|nr:ABZJ_00895 family protein [Sulfitobacter algicola]NSX53935.1 hypothetical protein [Sulfitobacter algicola]